MYDSTGVHICFVDGHIKIVNNSDFNMVLCVLPEGKKKLRDCCFIAKKRFLILSEKIDLTKIYIRFSDEM